MAVEISPQNRGLRTLQSLVDQLLNSRIKPDISVPIVLGEFLSLIQTLSRILQALVVQPLCVL